MKLSDQTKKSEIMNNSVENAIVDNSKAMNSGQRKLNCLKNSECKISENSECKISDKQSENFKNVNGVVQSECEKIAKIEKKSAAKISFFENQNHILSNQLENGKVNTTQCLKGGKYEEPISESRINQENNFEKESRGMTNSSVNENQNPILSSLSENYRFKANSKAAEIVFYSGKNGAYDLSVQKSIIGNENNGLKRILLQAYRNKGRCSIMNSPTRAIIRTWSEENYCLLIDDRIGLNQQSNSYHMNLQTLLSLCRFEVCDHQTNIDSFFMQMFTADEIENQTKAIPKNVKTIMRTNSSNEIGIILSSDEYIEHNLQNNAMVRIFAGFTIEMVGMRVVSLELYELPMFLYMLMASMAHNLTALKPKFQHRISPRLSVVFFEYFVSAMRESIRIQAQLTFTYIYTRDNRIPTAVPIYMYGFIHRKDNVR